MDMTFFRAALLGACVLFSGCDSATTPATPASTATVLDGKTMGTFWRVSVIGVDEAKAGRCAQGSGPAGRRRSPAVDWKNDSALMRFNHAADTRPRPVSEAMADIVTLSLRIGAKTDGAMDITVGPLVNLWGFGPDKQPVATRMRRRSPRRKRAPACSICRLSIRAAGSSCKKTFPICLSTSPPWGRLCRRPPCALDGAGGSPAIWCRWAGRWSAAG